MSLRIDKVQLEIIINNDEARKRLRALDTDIQSLSKELNRLPEGSEEFVRKSEQLRLVEAEYEKVKREIGITGMSLKELQNHQRELNAVMLHMNPNIPQYKILQAELRATNARVTELRNGAREMPSAMQRMGDSFNRYQSVAMAAGVALMGLVYTFKTFIQGGADLSDSLADIQKTTQMSASEVKNLNAELGKIDTRTSRKELRDMAVVAGQLGISKDSIYDFVKSVDVLNVALGDEITGGAGEVARVMGTLRNVLTDLKSNRVDQDMMRIGDALNELGKAGFATAPVIADFANRIGGIGIPLGLTSDEILGLSATLQELNVNTERGGTAIGRILQKMTRNTEDFAKVAGMPVKEFTNLVNSDLMGAFIKVVEGSKRGGTSATALSAIIKELEVQGAGASEVFAKLGNNVSMLHEKMDLAGKTLQASTSSTDEFNIKNQTLGAIVDKLVKSFYGLIMLPSLQEFFKSIVMGAVEVVAWFKVLPQTIEKYRISLILLVGALGVWIAAITREIQVKLINNIVDKEGWLLRNANLVTTKIATAWERLYTFAKSEGTFATKAATASQWLWNAAMTANPIGVIIGLVTAAVAAIKAYDKYNAESIRIEEYKADALTRTNVLTMSAKAKTDIYSASIRAMNNLSRDKKDSLREEIELMVKSNSVELESLKLKRQTIFADGMKLSLWQKMGVALGATNMTDTMIRNSKEAVKDIDESIKAYEQNISVAIDQKKTLDDVLNAEAQGDAIGTATIEEMDAKMSKYQIALRNLTKGGEDYLRVQQKIKDLNKLRNVETPDSKPDKSEEKALKDKNKLLEEYQRLMLDLQAFEVKQLEERMNMYSKEVYAIERKYDAEIEKAKKFLAENEKLSPKQKRTVQQGIDVLEVQKGQAVKDELLKQETVFTTDVIAVRNKLKATQLVGYEKELQEIENTYNKKIEAVTGQSDAIAKYYDDEIAKASGNALLIIDLENQKQNHITNAVLTTSEYEKLKAEEVAALKEKKARDLEEEIQKIQEGRTAYNLSQEQKEISEIDSKYAKLLLMAEGNEVAKMRIEKMYADEIADYKANKSAETQRKINAFLVDQAQLLSNTVFEIVGNNNRSELDSKLAALSSQKERELSSKSLTEAQKAEIEAKYKRKEAAIKTKAWKDEQKAALAQAVINGALAITMILATTPKFDFGIATAILIGASIASTIAAVAKITSQKPPQFKAGGYTGDGSPEVPAGVVHKGEYVIPASLVKEPDIARQIKIIESRRKNTSGSQYATGGAVGSFADFNYPVITQAIRSAPMQANFELLQRHTQQIIHQINIPQLIEKSMKQSPPMGTPNLEKVIGELTKKLAVMDQLKKKLDTGIRSHIVYQDIIDAQDTIKAIKSDTSR
ncbi:MAG: phage tail tape measure protein [Bacteroidota bacterium]